VGSISALAGALAAALAAMNRSIDRSKPKYGDWKKDASSHGPGRCALELTALVERMALAYDAVVAAMKLPKALTTKGRATDGNSGCKLHAAQVPLETARLSLQALELALIGLQAGNVNSMKDAAVA
jgi:formiminotetrahydrofolate cyclodeaminase